MGYYTQEGNQFLTKILSQSNHNTQFSIIPQEGVKSPISVWNNQILTTSAKISTRGRRVMHRVFVQSDRLMQFHD